VPADETIVQSGQTLIVSTGTQQNILVENGGTLVVESTGVVSSITNYGLAEVSAGGTAINTIISEAGTSLLVVSSGGTASGTIAIGGETIESGGLDVGAVTSFDQIVLGTAQDAIVLSGYQEIEAGGRAINTTLSGGSYQNVYAGGSASRTTVNAGGTQADWGNANQATVSSGGYQYVSSGGVASGTSVLSGGEQVLYASGTAVATSVENFDAYEYVSSGGVTSATQLASGGQLYLFIGGTASGTIVSAGGYQWVQSGATAVGTTISGYELVYSGGATSNTTLVNGGYLELLGGATNTNLAWSGGILYVASGFVIGGLGVTNGQVLGVGYNGLASGVVITNGGQEIVYGGGIAVGTVVSGGGVAAVSSGGAASNTVLNGGFEYVYSGGTATGTTVSSGTEQYVEFGGAASGTVLSGGFQGVYSGGIAAATTIGSGGVQIVFSGGSTSAATIAGGTLLLESGATANGSLTFANDATHGTLAIDGTTVPGNTIVGFATQDTIDLLGVAYSSTGIVGLLPGNLLRISENGLTYTLTLDPSQSFAGEHFRLVDDNIGGTAVRISLSVPVPTGLTLDPASDSGAKGDGITNDATPAITGLGETGNTVTLYDGVTAVGSTTVASAGTWLITTSTLSDGPHSLTAKQTDNADNVSNPSTVLSITIDTQAPAAPSGLALDPASDSGAKGDGITNDATPAITGLGETGNTVTLYDGVTAVGSTTVASAGTWLITTSTLSDGPHSLTAKQTDNADNVSNPSTVLSITIDTQAPAAPSGLALDPASDSGAKGDGITNDATPAITGLGETGNTVTLYDGVTAVGTTTVASAGTWLITTSTLSDGPHSLTAKQTDNADNVSLTSAALPLTINTAPPTTTSASLIVAISGAPTWIGIIPPTDASTYAIVVTGLPTDGTVLLSDGTTAVTTGQSLTTTQLTGLKFKPTGSAGESSTFTYSVTDAAGNSAPGSATLAVQGGGSGPTVIAVAAQPSTGDEAAGTLILIGLGMSAAVTVSGGTPSLALNDGGTATYDAANSTASSLVFRYTVAAGQDVSALAITGYSPNGATIKDSGGNSADLSGAVHTFSGLQIDTTAPTTTPASLTVQVGSAPTSIGITAPIDASSFTVVVTGLPNDGTVYLSDGTTAVTSGQSLTTTQLAGLKFKPAGIAGQSSTFTYSVTDAAGNSAPGSATLSISTCFLRGTLILTERGEVPVEKLAVGDRVQTLSGALKPIVWIGMGRDLVTRANKLARPVIVRRSALADNVPHRDLYLTHGHALYLDGVLIPVENLVNHRSIVWDETARVVEYYHIELEDHDVVLAEGAPAESYYDANNRALFHNARPGSVAGAAKPPFAPVLTGGEVVERIWVELFERAGGGSETETTDDPDIRLLVDGERQNPAVDGCTYTFALDAPPTGALHLRSRSGVPSLLGITAHDHRRLGVALTCIELRQPGLATVFEHDAPLFLDGGSHPPENGYCWTDGELTLPAYLFAHLDGPCTLTVHTERPGMRYPIATATAVAA